MQSYLQSFCLQAGDRWDTHTPVQLSTFRKTSEENWAELKTSNGLHDSGHLLQLFVEVLELWDRHLKGPVADLT